MAIYEHMFPVDNVKDFLKAFPTDQEINKQLRKCFQKLVQNELPDSVLVGDVEPPRHADGNISIEGVFKRKGHRLLITASRYNDTKTLIVEDRSIFNVVDGYPSFKFDWKGRKTLAEAIDEHGFFKDTDAKPVDRTTIPLKLYVVWLEPLTFGYTSAIIACESQELLQALFKAHAFEDKKSDRIEYLNDFATQSYLPNGIPSEEPAHQGASSIKYLCECDLRSAKEAVVVLGGGFKE